jgi:hypothetical protein
VRNYCDALLIVCKSIWFFTSKKDKKENKYPQVPLVL